MADAARIEALEQQLQDFRDELAIQTALITQQATQLAQQAAQPVIPQPVQPGPFVLTPALANQSALIYHRHEASSSTSPLLLHWTTSLMNTNQFSALYILCFNVEGTILLSARLVPPDDDVDGPQEERPRATQSQREFQRIRRPFKDTQPSKQQAFQRGDECLSTSHIQVGRWSLNPPHSSRKMVS
jgi:hypothetical protein